MKLSFRLAVAFVAFVILGSLALVVWMSSEERRQSREQFVAMARTNAEFVRAQNLPLTERTAASLASILGVEVYLWEGPWKNAMAAEDEQRLMAPVERKALRSAIMNSKGPDPGLRSYASGEAIHISIGPEKHAVFFRMAPSALVLRNPRTYLILVAFWTLSFALAWALARGIVRPLRALAARLPRIAEEKNEAIPETARTDEIGQLARAYADTRAQLAIERTAREQAERLATLGKMATGLAHEINNPVAAIKLHTQLLEGDTESAPESRLRIILAEAAKIESLVSQWMFLARPQPPQVSDCDFAEILSDSIRVHAPAARHARVNITNDVPAGCIVRADRRRLAQAIANVLMNAIHAMSAGGGELAIRSCARESAGILDEARSNPAAISPRSHERSYSAPTPTPAATINSQPPTINFTFTDSGPGFSAAALSRATELFFSEKEGGMGIGLSVTSEILRAHGGELHIANAHGGGAVVTFVLPAAS